MGAAATSLFLEGCYAPVWDGGKMKRLFGTRQRVLRMTVNDSFFFEPRALRYTTWQLLDAVERRPWNILTESERPGSYWY